MRGCCSCFERITSEYGSKYSSIFQSLASCGTWLPWKCGETSRFPYYLYKCLSKAETGPCCHGAPESRGKELNLVGCSCIPPALLRTSRLHQSEVSTPVSLLAGNMFSTFSLCTKPQASPTIGQVLLLHIGPQTSFLCVHIATCTSPYHCASL